MLTRREFIGGALAAAALGACRTERELPGELLGPNHVLGHKLRTGGFDAPTKIERVPVVIVGGGAAGLSAGWKLLRSGFKDFVVLDLESRAGGNAAWGENEVSRYPWGAHYLPVPGPHARAVRELLRELKVIVGEKNGRPVYDEDVLCHAPEERLYIHGRWQDGLFPRLGASAADLAERDRFNIQIAALRRRVGSDGRPAFAIPMENSSRDPEILALDRISMATWLDQNHYRSPGLRWYVEYACRDDFGGGLGEVSAWAGLQYYAARGEGADDAFLVWPEGNGFLVRKLAEALGPRVRTGALAYAVSPDAKEDDVRDEKSRADRDKADAARDETEIAVEESRQGERGNDKKTEVRPGYAPGSNAAHKELDPKHERVEIEQNRGGQRILIIGGTGCVSRSTRNEPGDHRDNWNGGCADRERNRATHPTPGRQRKRGNRKT